MKNKIVDNIGSGSLLLAVAMLPFSVRICHWALILHILCWFADKDLKSKIQSAIANPIVWATSIFVCLHLLAMSYTEDQSNGWANLDKKLFLFLLPPVIASEKIFTPKFLQILLIVFIASCTLGTLICCINSFNVAVSGEPIWSTIGPTEYYRALHPNTSVWWKSFTYTALASGIGMHPTYLGLYLLVCISGLFYLLTIYSKQKVVIAFLASFLSIFIVFLGTRITILLLIVMVIVFINRQYKIHRWAVSGIALIVIVGLIWVNPIVRYRNLEEYTVKNLTWPPQGHASNSISIRTALWWTNLHAMTEVNALVGAGTGDVNKTMQEIATKYQLTNSIHTQDPHNQYIHTYLALGLPGLTALLVCLLLPLRYMWKRQNVFALLPLVAFAVICLTESALELQKGIVIFSLGVSIVGNVCRNWSELKSRISYA